MIIRISGDNVRENGSQSDFKLWLPIEWWGGGAHILVQLVQGGEVLCNIFPNTSHVQVGSRTSAQDRPRKELAHTDRCCVTLVTLLNDLPPKSGHCLSDIKPCHSFPTLFLLPLNHFKHLQKRPTSRCCHCCGPGSIPAPGISACCRCGKKKKKKKKIYLNFQICHHMQECSKGVCVGGRRKWGTEEETGERRKKMTPFPQRI